MDTIQILTLHQMSETPNEEMERKYWELSGEKMGTWKVEMDEIVFAGKKLIGPDLEETLITMISALNERLAILPPRIMSCELILHYLELLKL
jgi:hypothetical protein